MATHCARDAETRFESDIFNQILSGILTADQIVRDEVVIGSNPIHRPEDYTGTLTAISLDMTDNHGIKKRPVLIVTLTAKNNGKKIACHAIKAVRIRKNARVMK